MHGTFERGKPEKPEQPPALKREVIYLTNRAPVAIIEDDWLDMSQGSIGYEHDPDYGYGWGINIRLRRHKDHKRIWNAYLLYAVYVYDTHDEDACDRVRVGHLLSTHDVAGKLWTHIAEIGDELRERIACKAHAARVINAVDLVFQHLDAQNED